MSAVASTTLPSLAPPFVAVGAQGEHIGVELEGARALFTTRRGGVSRGPFATLNLGLMGPGAGPSDDPDAVHENRRRVAALAGTSWDRVARSRQVHGTTVRIVEGDAGQARPRRTGQARPRQAQPGPPRAEQALACGDGLVTRERGRPLLVLVADCLPVALVSRREVAMLHVGWRGLAGGILERGLAELRAPSPTEVAAVIGPGVGGCCYEVGAEVAQTLGAHQPGARAPDGAPSRVDLKLLVRERLSAAGVSRVLDVGLCTMCSPTGLFFSHRRDRGLTGRQAGLVWRS